MDVRGREGLGGGGGFLSAGGMVIHAAPGGGDDSFPDLTGGIACLFPVPPGVPPFGGNGGFGGGGGGCLSGGGGAGGGAGVPRRKTGRYGARKPRGAGVHRGAVAVVAEGREHAPVGAAGRERDPAG